MAKVEVDIRDKKLVTTDEAAALLSTSPGTIRKILRAGLLPYLRLGAGIFIYQFELDEFCKAMAYKQFNLNTLEAVQVSPSDISA